MENEPVNLSCSRYALRHFPQSKFWIMGVKLDVTASGPFGKGLSWSPHTASWILLSVIGECERLIDRSAIRDRTMAASILRRCTTHSIAPPRTKMADQNLL